MKLIVCTKCGHNKVGLSGFCIQQMPDAYGDLHGGGLCACKCEFSLKDRVREVRREINALRFEPRELNISQLRGMPEYTIAAVTGIPASALSVDDLRARVRAVREKARKVLKAWGVNE